MIGSNSDEFGWQSDRKHFGIGSIRMTDRRMGYIFVGIIRLHVGILVSCVVLLLLRFVIG